MLVKNYGNLYWKKRRYLTYNNLDITYIKFKNVAKIVMKRFIQSGAEPRHLLSVKLHVLSPMCGQGLETLALEGARLESGKSEPAGLMLK